MARATSVSTTGSLSTALEPGEGCSRQLEAVFSLLSSYKDDGWEEVLSHEGRGIGFCKPFSNSSVLLQWRYSQPLALEELLAVMRPEAFGEFTAPYTAQMFSEKKIVKIIEPGDIICSIQPQRWLNEWEKLTNTESFGRRLRRAVMRRDFPHPGATSLATGEVERSIAGLEVVNGFGIVMFPEGSGSGAAEVMVAPKCSMQALRPLMEKFWWNSLLNPLSSIVDPVKVGLQLPENTRGPISAWELLDFSKLQLDYGYVVVTMRKCCRGPPLLPVSSPEARSSENPDSWASAIQWEPADPNELHLPEYLRSLLLLAGEDPSIIHNRLDGRELLFYQAAVRRNDWPRIADILHLLVKHQQKAYRRLYGGTGAPYLQVDVPPRYMVEDPRVVDMGPQDLESVYKLIGPPSMKDPPSLMVKNTFLHFGHDDADGPPMWETGSLA